MIKVSNNNLDLSPYDDDQINWIYCALDCTLTQEIWEKIETEFDNGVLNVCKGRFSQFFFQDFSMVSQCSHEYCDLNIAFLQSLESCKV